MRVIVMANGWGKRWADGGGTTPKHLLVVDGETLLERITRQVHSLLRSGELVISGPYDLPGTRRYTPSGPMADWCDGRLGVQPLWSDRERTVILLGDTFYTDEAMAKILDHQGREPCLFARFRKSRLTGKPWPEPFANSMMPRDREAHFLALTTVHDMAADGIIPRAGLWEAYKLQHKALLPFRWDQRNLGNAVEIDDWTEDFDSPADYERWMKLRAKAGLAKVAVA